ncbi:g6162 [Coccomyxa elongata]
MPAYYIMLTLLHVIVLPLSDLLTPDEAWRASFDAGTTFDAEVCRSRKALANFLFRNNKLANGGCYNITWTLAVQMHVYLLLPLALLLLRPQRRGFRTGVAVTSATIVACVVLYRAILLQSAPLWRYMPLPFFRPYDMVSAHMMHSLAHRSFLSLGASLSPLCLGMLAALAVTDETCRRILIRYRMWLSLAWAVLALCVLGACTVDRIGPAQDPKHPLANPIIFFAAFTLVQGFFLPLLPALTLLLITTQLPGPPAVLARLLSHAVCARLASISYEMYLVHSLVICGVFALFPPSTWFAVDNPVPFALIACHVIAVSAAAAWVLNRVVAALVVYIGRHLRFSTTPSAAA